MKPLRAEGGLSASWSSQNLPQVPIKILHRLFRREARGGHAWLEIVSRGGEPLGQRARDALDIGRHETPSDPQLGDQLRRLRTVGGDGQDESACPEIIEQLRRDQTPVRRPNEKEQNVGALHSGERFMIWQEVLELHVGSKIEAGDVAENLGNGGPDPPQREPASGKSAPISKKS